MRSGEASGESGSGTDATTSPSDKRERYVGRYSAFVVGDVRWVLRVRSRVISQGSLRVFVFRLLERLPPFLNTKLFCLETNPFINNLHSHVQRNTIIVNAFLNILN